MNESNCKCIFVLGPESSGSSLIARIVSANLNQHAITEYNGVNFNAERFKHRVCHRSLPSAYRKGPNWPDIDLWLTKFKDYDINFILCTRDLNISERSRRTRNFRTTGRGHSEESEEARRIMSDILTRELPSFIWSYETFMYLKVDYLRQLNRFLEIKAELLPELKDGNLKFLK